MEEVVTLFRPVGQAEMDLIRQSGRFPPRLEIQPIFYPVLTFEYAEKIARGWNTRDAASGYVGYVTKFAVRKGHLDSYPVQEAGGRECQEYWIPAEELDEFNANIVGNIEVMAEYRS
ncbi:MAG TPA: hypothetical protein VG944_08245 [Fimbriimonas sp.]|nr:hypothetical protein [Fimbriimonas sp.]